MKVLRLLFFVPCLLAAGASRSQTMTDVTERHAEAIVRTELARSPHDFVLLSDRTRTEPYGWVFFYAPSAYLKSGDPGDLVPGVGPIVVERNGKLIHLGSSVPPDVAIREFGRRVGRVK